MLPFNNDGTMQAAKRAMYELCISIHSDCQPRLVSRKTAPARRHKMMQRFQFPRINPAQCPRRKRPPLPLALQPSYSELDVQPTDKLHWECNFND